MIMLQTKKDVDDLVKMMDKMNIEKTMILTYANRKRF